MVIESTENIEELTPNDRLIHDFIQLISSKFEKLGQESNENILKFRVSHKETLSITYENQFSPEEIGDYNFNITIKDNKPEVQITGTFNEWRSKGIVSQPLNSNAFLKELENIEFADDFLFHDKENHKNELRKYNVNYHLMLLGLSKKEKYIRGKLKHWDRIDGRIIAKEDLGKRIKRLREWERKHPTPRPRQYTTKECIKAECIHIENEECIYNLNPTNNKEDTKLTNKATGYCFEFQSKEGLQLKEQLTNDILLPFSLRKFSFLMEINRLIRELRQIVIISFSHTVIKPFFSHKKLNSLMKLLYKKIDKRRETFLKHVKDNKSEILAQFHEVKILANEFVDKKANDKAYKKAMNEYNKQHNELIYICQDLTRKAKNLVKNVRKQNQLIISLFEDTEKEQTSVFTSFKVSSLVYFPYSKTSDARNIQGNKTKNQFNVGRENIDNKWHDVNLSPIGDLYSYNQKTNYPIFKVISVKKTEVTLKQLYTKKEIRLLKNRDYLAYNLYSKTAHPHAALNCIMLLLLLTAFSLHYRIKPPITKQISLNSFF